MIVLILIWTVCLLSVYWLWSQRSRDTENEPPMCPGALPVIGHAHRLIGDSNYLWHSMVDLANKSYATGGVVSAAIGPRTIYVVTDPDDFFTVANNCLQKDGFYDFAKPWLGEGLVTGTLSIWRNHRKLLNPAFSNTVLDGFIEVFNSQSRRLVKDLSVEVGKGAFDHWTYTRHNALETICLTALGVDFTDHNLLNSQYVVAAEQIFNTMVDRFQKFWLHSPLTFRFSGVKKKQDECLKILHNMSNTVLQRRKSEFVGNVLPERKTGGSTRSKFKAFMDLLLELSIEKGVFNDREIREHVDTMIVGGHDTSANVLMFTLILLGSHPEAQDRVFEELQDVFGDSDRNVDKHDISQLVYLEAVLKESMRIHTIVPIVARRLDKNVQLKNYTLAAGRTCFLFLFGLHRHPMWGETVDEFRPERWLDPTSLPDNPNAFAGFSMGRRMCIGKTYALMSMKITLAHLLRHYKVFADHTKLELKLDVMLKPSAGHSISIERLVTDPDDASIVLNRCLDKLFCNVHHNATSAYRFFFTVAVWKRNRRIVDYAFKPKVINGYVDIFNRHSKRLADSMEANVGNYEDFSQLLIIKVLEVSCETALGVNSDDKLFMVDDEYAAAIHKVLDILTLRCANLWTIPDIMFYFSSLRQQQNKALKIISEKMRKVIKKKKTEYLESISLKQENVETESEKFQSALNIILEKSMVNGVRLFTDEQLRQLVDNLLLATFDTSSFELLYTLICIGTHSEIQEKVYNEIKNVVGDSDNVTKDHLSQLSYLEAVIKESIRLFPIAPVIGRQTDHEVQLKNTTIPPGGRFVVHIWEINRNTKLWGVNAEQFRPERWLNPDLTEHPAAFASFAPGKRNCPGKLYAMLYLKTSLVHILRRFHVTADYKDLKLVFSVMAKPKSGHLIKLVFRNK
ncbi:cytochrome P450 4C1-like [Achroia grisella]|uniref:cytochrome P450 4C1-like n=1 Tax=Achroia grisella TaxID=688607 RepID=UPI0027D2516D|nr:cytochrome P450 4C1-like [Achroia grisella]